MEVSRGWLVQNIIAYSEENTSLHNLRGFLNIHEHQLVKFQKDLELHGYLYDLREKIVKRRPNSPLIHRIIAISNQIYTPSYNTLSTKILTRIFKNIVTPDYSASSLGPCRFLSKRINIICESLRMHWLSDECKPLYLYGLKTTQAAIDFVGRNHLDGVNLSLTRDEITSDQLNQLCVLRPFLKKFRFPWISQLESLGALPTLHYLTVLQVGHTNMSVLDLSAFTRLEELSVYERQGMTSAAEVILPKVSPYLKILSIENTRVQSITVPKAPNLEVFFSTTNFHLTHIYALDACPRLQKIGLLVCVLLQQCVFPKNAPHLRQLFIIECPKMENLKLPPSAKSETCELKILGITNRPQPTYY